jgi:cobaltochelatase CobN
VRLGYLFSDGNIPGTLAAFEALLRERPDLKGKVELELLSESTLAEAPAEAARRSDVLIFDTMNEQMLGKFDAQSKADLLAEVARKGVVLGVGEGLLPKETHTQKGVVFDPAAQAYWRHAGPQNQLSLMKLALTKAGITGLEPALPQSSLDFGYYYPDGRSGHVFATWDEFQAWKAANGKVRPGAPRVAIGFFKATYYSGDTGLLDALIREVERQGGDPVPIFGYPGAVAFEKLLLDPSGAARADVGLGLNFQFADPQASKALERLDIPVINLISLYGRSEQDWRTSTSGLSAFEGTFNLAVPELAGTISPTVVGTKEKVRDPGTGLTSVITSPIGSRVTTAVARGLKYAALRRTANADKRIALIYYNYPPGKANIGASYLNVAETLANILRQMKAEGYDVGDRLPSADEILAAITLKARNVMGEAPGELQAMLAEGGANRVTMGQYGAWLDALAPSLKAKVLKDWGKPEESRLMIDGAGDQRAFVIPGVQYGKVLLTPQASRAWGEDLEKLYHAKDLAPQHQYVAAYAWLRNGFKADAVVHIGTHGTLEWLDGRDAGLGEDDAPDALIADLPHAYVYNVDVVGEGLVARRRGMATLVDHMVPPFKQSALTEELARLSELINDHTQNESKNPELAARYGEQVREQAAKMGIAKDVGLDPARRWSDEELHRLETYLLELGEQRIPYGLHALGRTPKPDAVASTVEAIVSIDRSALPNQQKVFADDMRQRIESSGPRELASLMKALAGRFVPGGSGGEPIRNPDAYATGKNFYGVDPDKIPKPAAWEVGSKLAEEMLQQHLKRTGKYPESVSFVIWGDETMRHEGVLESQIFYLLGSKPVWDARGKLVGAELIPRAQLGRPRVDIVIASAAEGMFNNVTRMMDAAVQLAKAEDEPDNAVRRHYLATKAVLIARGVEPELADRMAGVRIFDEPPGQFNLNTSTIVAASGSWETEAGFANDYVRKLGHGYGNGFWGEAMPEVFRLNLAKVETVVHSSSTALYGALDNDDMFMYMGGLAAAVRAASGGKDPEMLVTDSRDPGKPAMTGLDRFIGREFRSRYVNPTWIRGMQKEGYAGAGEMRAFVEYLWGWKATVPKSVDDAMWKETFETYVEDKHDLGMKAFFEGKSPFAYQDITARMIETVRKGAWEADAAIRRRLLSEYIDSVNRHGVSCTDVSCGNGRLLQYVMQEAARAGVPAPAVAQARAALEKAMGKSIDRAAQDLETFARNNEVRERAEQARTTPRSASAPSAAPPSPTARQRVERPPTKAPTLAEAAAQVLQGMVMREEERSSQAPAARTPAPVAPLSPWSIAWPALLLLALLTGMRWRGGAHARA